MYSAIRGIDERILLLNNTGDYYAEANQPKLAVVYFKKAKESEKRLELLRKTVHSHEQLSKDILLKDADEEA